MTRDDIIRMAQEAGLAFDSEEFPEIWQTYMDVGREQIERFAALVEAEKDKEIAALKDERRRDMAEICSLRESEESLREEVERLRDELRRLDPAWCALHDAEQISDEKLDELIGEVEEAVDAGLIVVGPARAAA